MNEPADNTTSSNGSMYDWNDIVQFGLECRVKVFGSSNGDQTVFVGQFGEYSDFIVSFELNSKRHFKCKENNQLKSSTSVERE